MELEVYYESADARMELLLESAHHMQCTAVQCPLAHRVPHAGRQPYTCTNWPFGEGKATVFCSLDDDRRASERT